MRTILLSLALLVHSSMAWSAGADLTWDDCVGGTTPHNKIFDCTTNANYNLHFQFKLDQPLPYFVSLTTFVNYQNASVTNLTPFWRFESGGCQMAPAVDGLAIFDNLGAISDLPSCGSGSFLDPWGGNGSDGVEAVNAYGIDFRRPGNGYLVLLVYRGDGLASPLLADRNYWAFRLNFRTVNRSACPGCADPGTIELDRMVLESYDPPAFPPATFIRTADKWGIAVSVNSDPTPVQGTTWGQIKSMYR